MKLRSELRKYWGDRCYWCGGVMEFPEIKEASVIFHIRAGRGRRAEKPFHMKPPGSC